MKARGQGGVFQFEGFRLDRQSRVLFRRDEAGAFVPMAVGSRALDVLDVLLDRAGNLVLRDELMAAVWPATAVEDTNLNMQIAAIRRILDEARTGRSCIQTIPGRGYRFAVPVTRVVADTSARQPSGAPPLTDKPSLAVMPFQNMSGDPEQEYFADGMVEEIITALSRITWLFVIARNSSFTYKGQAVDVKQVGRELGVRYVLEGAVRKAAGRVRISAQLIDAANGAHLWADRFDGSLEDVFELQDRVAFCVAGVIEPTLQAVETARSADRPTNDLAAYDLYLRAYEMYFSSAQEIPEALRLLERAIERDPRYGPALAWAAGLLSSPRRRRIEHRSRVGHPQECRFRPASLAGGWRRPRDTGQWRPRVGLLRRGHWRHDDDGRSCAGAQPQLCARLVHWCHSQAFRRPV